MVTPILSALPSAKKAPPGERTRTIILSKAHEADVVKQMQFTHLASHMRVTHQSRSLSKLAPYRDCSLSLNHNGTHNIHTKNRILDAHIQHASDELNSNVKDQRVLLNIFKKRLESPVLEQSRNLKIGGYWSAQEKYRSTKTITTKKEPLVKFFDVNPFDESPGGAVAKKAAEFAHRQLSMGVISDLPLEESSSITLPPKAPKFKKLLQMSQANKQEIRGLDKEYTPIFSHTESFKVGTPSKPVLQHFPPTTPMARPST